MYEPLPGFNRAQAAYEAQEPDYGCECPQLFQCQRCDEVTAEPHEEIQCPDSACREDAAAEIDTIYPATVIPIDREDNDTAALQGCKTHGWCGGCSSRYCEDCNG